jgi:uncharacterized protein (TIGR00290 family)
LGPRHDQPDGEHRIDLTEHRIGLALSWSGGKDSAFALWTLRRAGTPPSVLLTVTDEESGAVAHHGVSGSLLRAQADAAGVELVTVPVPAGAGNEVYEQRLRDAFAGPPLDRAGAVAFGDLFLADLRAYREERMTAAGLEARFPLWHADTRALAHEFVAAGFRALVVSVDGERLSPDLLGRELDERFLAELPADVDPCGENGEFHTFVFDGPVFDRPLGVRAGVRRVGERYAWLGIEARCSPSD